MWQAGSRAAWCSPRPASSPSAPPIAYEPDQAKGLDDTLRSFAESPVGPALLACVAVGLVLFGLFSFAMARWRKV